MAVTPFQLTEPFSMDSFNSRISEINTMFGGLGNEYVWARNTETPAWDETQEGSAGTQLFNTGATVTYADSFEFVDNKFNLVNPATISPTLTAEKLNVTKGKYISYDGSSGLTFIYKIPEDEVFGVDGSWVTISKSVTLLNNPRTEVSTVGYVNSPDPNAYPPSVPDGYTYTPLGQMGAKVQIATGSYTGTGTYGSSNPNSLTFDKKPIAVMIYAPTRFADKTTLWPYGKTIDVAFQASSAIQMNLTWSGNTLNWYYTGNDARAQLNVSGQTYEYLYVC